MRFSPTIKNTPKLMTHPSMSAAAGSLNTPKLMNPRHVEHDHAVVEPAQDHEPAAHGS